MHITIPCVLHDDWISEVRDMSDIHNFKLVSLGLIDGRFHITFIRKEQ